MVAVLLAVVTCGVFAAFFLARLTSLAGDETGFAPVRSDSYRPDRYRPMLRLLSESDLEPLRANPKLLKKVRAQRVSLFRGYVRCLVRDYSRALAGLRLAAVQSATDRPDIANALLRNQILFAATLCRIDAMVFCYRLGIREIDLTGLVGTMEALSAQMPPKVAAARSATA
jgi:hypothetical protein